MGAWISRPFVFGTASPKQKSSRDEGAKIPGMVFLILQNSDIS
jgi:hypothetical protein